jgi:phage terminase large subunit
MAAAATLTIPTADVFAPLYQPARYKAAWGGRGSGKSHDRAGALIDDSLYEKGLLSVCIREVQKSLKDSAKRLIEAKLGEFRLGEADGFKVFADRIQTPGDGIIIFQGMQDHTAESIKSLEGFKRAWVEEAQTLSARSLQLLRPTIRAPQSELWFTWNPRRKIDPVDVMFRGQTPPTNSIVVKANWNDNPWFPAELEQERKDCLRDDPDGYDHIWEGGYVTVSKGAYFARHLAQARADNRIGFVGEDPNLIVRLFADLGGTGAKADNFVFWAAQHVGTEIRWVNHYEAQGQPISTHLEWLRSQGYTPSRAKIWLPHDGETHDRVFNVSFESAFRQAGYEVSVVPNQGKGAAKARIEEARRLFPRMRFDAAKCDAGLQALGWYHEKHDEQRDIGLGPEHDWASHSADAFGLGCIAHKEEAAPVQPKPVPQFAGRPGGWMAGR